MRRKLKAHARHLIRAACTLVPVLAACSTDTAGVAAPPTGADAVLPNGKTVQNQANWPPAPASPRAALDESAERLSPTELKYRVLALFPNPFFCDPDQYPVAVAREEAERASAQLEALRKDPEQLRAILRHNGLVGAGSVSDADALRIYRDHKRLQAIALEPAVGGYRFELSVREAKQSGFIVKGSIDTGGNVTVKERLPSTLACPVCLSPQTRISTPRGPVPIADLRVGDPLWTADPTGEQLAATVAKTVRVPVPVGHRMVQVLLEDGRALRASLGHPTADGHTIGDLKVGELLDGGLIVQISDVSDSPSATFDVLPSGPTGQYWADGIRVGSTLADLEQRH